MPNLFYDLYRKVINPVVGFEVNGVIVPLNTKGEVIVVNFEDKIVRIEWQLEEEQGKVKKLYTSIPFEQYDKLNAAKVIDDLGNYVKKPEPKFKVGDMVEGFSLGLVRGLKFNPLEKKWYYSVIDIENMFFNDYELRYREEEEEYMKLVEKIECEAEFKNKKFKVLIEEINA